MFRARVSYFVLGIVKLVILEASAFLLILDRALGEGEGEKWKTARRWGWIGLAVIALSAFTNFGEARGGGTMVHTWEQFHFYMGAKYLREVGWFDLYKASLIADRETVNRLRDQKTIREIRNFELIPAEAALLETDRIRAQFSPARWEAFKNDWTTWARIPMDWNGVLNDHGNSNSPAWAIIATPLSNALPVARWAQLVISGLDIFLMVILGWMLLRTFGVKVACVGIVIFSSAPIVFDYLAGSFLRWDWLFAVGMSACFLKRGRHAVAGAFLGYAVATKLFPLFFGVALLFHWGAVWLRERTVDRRWIRFVGGGAAALAVSVLLSSAMLGSPRVWLEYKERVAVAQVEKFYSIQYSLKTVYLQTVVSSANELRRNWFFPNEIKQARSDVDIKDHRTGLFFVQMLFTVFIAALARKGDEVSALLLGPLLVFTWLVVNMYYWNMLALTAIAFVRRDNARSVAAAIWLHFNFGLFYLYQHTRHGHAEGYVVALFIAFGIAGFGIAELYLLWEERKALRAAGPVNVAVRGK